MLTKIIATVVITTLISSSFVIASPPQADEAIPLQGGFALSSLAVRAAIQLEYQASALKAINSVRKARRAVRGDSKKLTILGAGTKGIAYALAARQDDDFDYEDVILIAEDEDEIKRARAMLTGTNVQIYDFGCDLDKICEDTDTTIITISPKTEEEARELYLKATERTRNDGSICIAAPAPKKLPVFSCEEIHSREKSVVGVDETIVLPVVDFADKNGEPDVFVEKEKPDVEPDTKAQYEKEAGDLYLANEVKEGEDYDGETYQAPYLLEQADKEAGTPAKWGVRTMKIPTEAPPGGMVIEIISSSVCGTDLGQVRGDRPAGKHAHGVLGHEAVGIIRHIDEEANSYIRPENGQTPFKVGDTVILDPNVPERPGRECATCRKGASLMCDQRTARSHHTPGLSERFAIVHPREVQNIIKVSPDVNPDHAAINEPIACAYYSLRESVRQLERDPEKLVIWGSGFQGIIHAVFAALVKDVRYKEIIIMGRNEKKNGEARQILSQLKTDSRIIVVNSSELKAEATDKFTAGADTTILAFSPRTIEEAVEVYTDALRRTADGGVLNLYGVIKGAPHVIPARDIYERGVTVLGNSGAPINVAQDTAKLIEDEILPPDILDSLVTHRFTLDEIEQATSPETAKKALKIIIEPQWQDVEFSVERADLLLRELFKDIKNWQPADWTASGLLEKLRGIPGSRGAERIVLADIFNRIEAGSYPTSVFRGIAAFYRHLLMISFTTAEERLRALQRITTTEFQKEPQNPPLQSP